MIGKAMGPLLLVAGSVGLPPIVSAYLQANASSITTVQRVRRAGSGLGLDRQRALRCDPLIGRGRQPMTTTTSPAPTVSPAATFTS